MKLVDSTSRSSGTCTCIRISLFNCTPLLCQTIERYSPFLNSFVSHHNRALTIEIVLIFDQNIPSNYQGTTPKNYPRDLHEKSKTPKTCRYVCLICSRKATFTLSTFHWQSKYWQKNIILAIILDISSGIILNILDIEQTASVNERVAYLQFSF